MKKNKIYLFFLIIAMLFTTNSRVFACDEEQTNTYVTQILFGSDALSKRQNDKVQMLLDALYLCSEQADGTGQDKLNNLNEMKVSGVPALDALNIKSSSLFECAHNSWNHQSSLDTDKQASRKKLLQSTVKKVFGVNFFNQWFGGNKGKCEAFAELLYYSHILADHLADFPEATSVKVNHTRIPAYTGNPCYMINNDRPSFTEEQKHNNQSFLHTFSPFDKLGRSGTAFVLLGPKTLETGKGVRENIYNIEPSGYSGNNKQYPDILGGQTVYNRCHLVAHQLFGNDAANNLITGTRYLNMEMVKLENEIARLISQTGYHVLYRVTPVYNKDNAVAAGVHIEAYSIEDDGAFQRNRFYYNVQPGINVDYANGSNSLADFNVIKDEIMPFVAKEGSYNTADLCSEFSHVFERLFDEELSPNTLRDLKAKTDDVEKKARDLLNRGDGMKSYYELLKLENDYLEILKTKIPALLKKEAFFNTVFD